MKIEVMGYSGSGKSTLCQKLGELYNVPVLHMDSVHFLPNWEIRADEEKQEIVKSFLDNNPNGWIIDGNYKKLSYDRRVEEADVIIQLLFNRFNCLHRCIKRYRTYKGKTRPDMAEGCLEKIDAKFVKWILWDGRTIKVKNRYKAIRKKYPAKVVVIKNQKQLDKYLDSLTLS